MADCSRTSQRQQMAPGTLAVFKAAGHQFGAPASLWFAFSRFGARGPCAPGQGGYHCKVGGLHPARSRRSKFELTPRAAAGTVSAVRDDAGTDSHRTYSACRSESGFELGFRHHPRRACYRFLGLPVAAAHPSQFAAMSPRRSLLQSARLEAARSALLSAGLQR